MTFRKTVSAAVATTAMIVTGFAPAMAAPVSVGAAPAQIQTAPIAMSGLAWNADNSTAERRRSYRGNRGYRGYRGYRGRHRGIDGGDVVAGILILGGIAAIASAASNNNRDRNADDRDYRDRDYRSNDRRDNEPRSQIGTTSMDRAISVCSDAAERKAGRDARTSEITAVAKDGNGWRVEGQLTGASESNFLCGASNDRVDFVQLGSGNLAYSN